MSPRPICEPVELAPGASVVVDQVRHPAASPALGRLLHFHDVSELVLFEDVRGWFFADGQRYRLEPGSIAFIPSMRHHDFALDAGAKSWWLVQIDPYLVEQLALHGDAARLSRPLCARAESEDFARIRMLTSWLRQTIAHDPRDPTAIRLTELLLIATAQAPAASAAEPPGGAAHVERLLPVVERLRRDPARPMTLTEAATACNLSPAYFSRLFKQVFGMNFSDYARAYRLHVGARRIIATRGSISGIAYDLGFATPSHFAQRFHERFGVTPREYRRGQRGAGE